MKPHYWTVRLFAMVFVMLCLSCKFYPFGFGVAQIAYASAETEHGEEGHEEGHGHGHEDGEEDEGGARFGPGKAIVAANKKEGIQLSDKASKTLGLTHTSLTGEGTFKVPTKSLVFFKDEVGVYRLKNGWHKLIEVKLISKKSDEAIISATEIKSGDQIAKDGVPLLRTAELEAWGGSGDGHGH